MLLFTIFRENVGLAMFLYYSIKKGREYILERVPAQEQRPYVLVSVSVWPKRGLNQKRKVLCKHCLRSAISVFGTETFLQFFKLTLLIISVVASPNFEVSLLGWPIPLAHHLVLSKFAKRFGFPYLECFEIHILCPPTLYPDLGYDFCLRTAFELSY